MLQVRLHHAIYIHPLQLESRTSTAQWVLPSYKSTIPTCQVIPGNLEIHLSWQSVQQPQRRDPGSNYWHTVKAEVEEFWHTVKANYWHTVKACKLQKVRSFGHQFIFEVEPAGDKIPRGWSLKRIYSAPRDPRCKWLSVQVLISSEWFQRWVP